MPDFSFQGIKDAIGSLLGQSTGEDAVSMLMDDHKRVKEIFDTFKDLDNEEKIDAKHKALVELALHAAVEEKLVYPLLREEDEDDEVNEAVVEHHVVKLLIVELEAMKQPGSMLDAKFKVLGEIVEHHVKEEESEMFPKLRSSDNNLQELGAEIKALKEELLSKLGDADNLGKIDPELSLHSTQNGHDGEEHSNGSNGNRKAATPPRNAAAMARKGPAKKVTAKTTGGRKQAPTAKKSSISVSAKKVTKKSINSKTTAKAKPAKGNTASRAGTSASSKATTKSTPKAKKPGATARKAASTKKVAKKSK